jgi:hypothetical protein
MVLLQAETLDTRQFRHSVVRLLKNCDRLLRFLSSRRTPKYLRSHPNPQAWIQQ